MSLWSIMETEHNWKGRNNKANTNVGWMPCMLQKVKAWVENSSYPPLKFSFSIRWEGAIHALIFSAFLLKFSLVKSVQFFVIQQLFYIHLGSKYLYSIASCFCESPICNMPNLNYSKASLENSLCKQY